MKFDILETLDDVKLEIYVSAYVSTWNESFSSSFFRQNFWSFEENHTVHTCHFARQTCTQKTEIYKKKSSKCNQKNVWLKKRLHCDAYHIKKEHCNKTRKKGRKRMYGQTLLRYQCIPHKKKCQCIYEDKRAKPAAHLCPFSWVHFWLKNSLNLNNQNVRIKLFSLQLPNQHFSSPPLFSPGSPEACLRMRVGGIFEKFRERVGKMTGISQRRHRSALTFGAFLASSPPASSSQWVGGSARGNRPWKRLHCRCWPGRDGIWSGAPEPPRLPPLSGWSNLERQKDIGIKSLAPRSSANGLPWVASIVVDKRMRK